MALTFPLAVSAFFGGLRPRESTFHLPSNLSVSRTRGGAIRTAARGERLWTGRVTLRTEGRADAAATAALVAVLTEAGRSFFAHPVPAIAPRRDPLGAALAGYTPSIHAVPPGGRELRLAGLPPGYVLSIGDFLSFSYGSNPTRYALHQVATPSIADGAGITPLTEVMPPVRAGAATGSAVALVRPFMKAVLIPGDPGRAGVKFVDGLTLDFIQTLS